MGAASVVSTSENTANAELQLDRSGARSRVRTARHFSYYMALNPLDSRTLAVAILDPRSGTHDLSLMNLSKDSTARRRRRGGLPGIRSGPLTASS